MRFHRSFLKPTFDLLKKTTSPAETGHSVIFILH